MKTFKKILAGIALVILVTGLLTLLGYFLFNTWLWGVAMIGGIAAILLVMFAIGSVFWLIEYLNK